MITRTEKRERDLSAVEAAKYTGLSYATIVKYAPEIPGAYSVKRGSGHYFKWMFTRNGINAWLESREAKKKARLKKRRDPLELAAKFLAGNDHLSKFAAKHMMKAHEALTILVRGGLDEEEIRDISKKRYQKDRVRYANKPSGPRRCQRCTIILNHPDCASTKAVRVWNEKGRRLVCIDCTIRHFEPNGYEMEVEDGGQEVGPQGDQEEKGRTNSQSKMENVLQQSEIQPLSNGRPRREKMGVGVLQV